MEVITEDRVPGVLMLSDAEARILWRWVRREWLPQDAEMRAVVRRLERLAEERGWA